MCSTVLISSYSIHQKRDIMKEKLCKKFYGSAITVLLFCLFLRKLFFTDHYLPPWDHSLILTFLIELFVNLFYQHFESVIDISWSLGTDFNKRNRKLPCQSHTLLNSYSSVAFKIAFSRHENFIDITGCIGINLSHPFANVFKRCPISDWISEYDTGSSFVISLSNILEPLLPCSVPNLHFVLFLIDH